MIHMNPGSNLKYVSIIMITVLVLAALAAADLAATATGVKSQVEGAELQGALGKFFGNERVNVYITKDDGKKAGVGIIMEDRKVKSVELNLIEKATLKVYLTETALNEITTSQNQLGALQKALDDKVITYKGVGLKNKLKFSFLALSIRFAGGFSGGEESDNSNKSQLGEVAGAEEKKAAPAPAEPPTEESTPPSAVITPVTPEATEQPAPRIHIVAMTANGFDPDDLTIAVGETVEWKNAREGRYLKAMVLGSGVCSTVRSKIFSLDESYQYTFTKPGRCVFTDGILTTKTMIVKVE